MIIFALILINKRQTYPYNQGYQPYPGYANPYQSLNPYQYGQYGAQMYPNQYGMMGSGMYGGMYNPYMNYGGIGLTGSLGFMNCGTNQIWQQCGLMCIQTCQNQAPVCPPTCAPNMAGCTCTLGNVRDMVSGMCLPAATACAMGMGGIGIGRK